MFMDRGIVQKDSDFDELAGQALTVSLFGSLFQWMD